MTEQPTYLKLLRGIANAESDAHCYLTAWRDTTTDPDVRAVLTTEVIPWARGAVREVDIARRLMHYAVTRHTIPKGVDDRLVTVKDPAVLTFSEEELRALQARITDPNFRIFADRDAIT